MTFQNHKHFMRKLCCLASLGSLRMIQKDPDWGLDQVGGCSCTIRAVLWLIGDSGREPVVSMNLHNVLREGMIQFCIYHCGRSTMVLAKWLTPVVNRNAGVDCLNQNVVELDLRMCDTATSSDQPTSCIESRLAYERARWLRPIETFQNEFKPTLNYWSAR
jgi:hypothetical protein